MKKLIKSLLEPKYYDWQDIAIITSKGNWFLLQMRSHKKTNKKQFKQRPLGWVNSYAMKDVISDNVLYN